MPRSPLPRNGRAIDAAEAVKRMDTAIKSQTGARPEPFTPEPEPQKRPGSTTAEENVAIETLRQGTEPASRHPPAPKRPRRRNTLH
jgi:hypothetical protein